MDASSRESYAPALARLNELAAAEGAGLTGVADELLAPLWELLERPEFRAEVEALGGYSCAETGRRIR